MNTDQISTRGTRIGNETNTIVLETESIRCLRDQIIVEPLDWTPSKIIIIAGYKGKPLRGTVRAVGPGTYPKRYDGPKGRRTKSWDSKAFRPCDLKVGDVVEFGGLELGGYLFTTFLWGLKEMVIAREEDVAIVIDSDVQDHLNGIVDHWAGELADRLIENARSEEVWPRSEAPNG
jgi:co-chaperonin GroES (HSP10)